MDREVSLVLPTVKCPAGCSEYKHKCNDMPLDLVLQELLGAPLPLLMSATNISSSFTRIFRSDYLSPDKIAYNPRWLCQASVAKTKRGAPTVLCCRHHSHASKHQMIHPPRNPTGPLSSSFSGGLSTVVPIPRTIKKAKISGYSASFHMAHLEGSFCGLDTIYLSTKSQIQSINSTLGFKQDTLAYTTRHDVMAYSNKKYNSAEDGSIGVALQKCAGELYPYLAEMKNRFLAGATYVTLPTAIQMQQTVDFASPELGWKHNNHGNLVQVQFIGHYPNILVFAHPAVSSVGCRPPQPPSYKSDSSKDTRAVWYLSSIMLLVPELWEAVAAVRGKVDNEWEGNLLTFLTDKCLPHITPKSTRGNPFSRDKGEKKMVTELFTDRTSVLFRMGFLRNYIANNARLPTVLVHENCFPPEIVPNDKNAVVITRDYSTISLAARAWIPPESLMAHGRKWKLCYIGESSNLGPTTNPNAWGGTAYCRHSGTEFCHWWKVSRNGTLPEKHVPRFVAINMELPWWEVAVYVACNSSITSTMRDSILSSCGGQHKVYCHEHNYPLITAPSRTPLTCSCHTGALVDVGEELSRPDVKCNRKSVFSCAVPGCLTAICKTHHVGVLDWDGKYFVGELCGYGDARPVLHDIFDLEDARHHGHVASFLDRNLVPPVEGNNQDDGDEENEQNDGLPLNNVDRNNDNNGDDDSDQGLEAHFRLQENIDLGLFFTEARVGFDDEAYYTQYTGNDNADRFADPEDAIMPATDAGTLPVFSLVDEYCDYANASVANHVLLNNFGHMLIRRNQRLDGTNDQRHFLQRLVSKTPGQSLSLVYPEGMLFSEMFPWDNVEGDIFGAIPSSMLNTDRVLHGIGFASLEDHYRTRLSNQGIFASSDPKYHFFAFDCLSNLSLRGCDTRVILRRGFADMQGEGGVRFKDTQEDRILKTEQVDSSSVVNKLAKAINERPPTYFYTHTCSMKTHFGMKHLWDWLAGDEVVESFLDGTESYEERNELRRNIIDGNGVLLLRSWMEMVHIWISYITQSPEQPIGPVDQYLFRLELQDAKANVPHIHSLLWTTDDLDTEEGLNNALDRIRGFVLDFVRPHEREHYIETGVFEDNDAIQRFLSMVQTFLTHRHTRRCFVCKPSKNDEGKTVMTMKCKANDNWKGNPCPSEHSFVPIPVKHSKDAIFVMVSLGLGTVTDNGTFMPSEKCLQAMKHYPPAHGNEGIISPVFAGLIAINPNMSNVQFATGYTLSRYLAKYIVAVDLYNTIRITPPKKSDEQNTFTIHGQELPNQKVTGNRIQETKRKRSTNGVSRIKGHKEGRAFNVTEFYMMLYGYSPIITNISFHNISSRPYDERGGRDREPPIQRIEKPPHLQNVALTAIDCMPSHSYRLQLNLPVWRQLLDTQVQVVFDDIQSPVSTNQVTCFGARPPELMFVGRHQDYRRWFTETKATGNVLDRSELMEKCIFVDHHASLWIDGFDSHMQVREAAITAVIMCLTERKCSWFVGYDDMLGLFQSIQAAVTHRNTAGRVLSEQESNYIKYFVSEQFIEKLPVVWFHTARPTRNTRFLIHLLLTLGYIKDEYDLFGCHDLRESFIRAGLLDPMDPRGSANRLVRSYITEQLACLPAGTNTFDRYMVAAYHSISALFIENRIHTEDLPLVLYCRLRDETEEAAMGYQNERKLCLVQHLLGKLHDCGFGDLPTERQCIEATISQTVPWDMTTIPLGTNQPIESYGEQVEVLTLAKELIAHYKSAPGYYTKGICHAGAGGVGKTTLLYLELLYCICQGLNTGITALLSERAQELSGNHIHDMFCFRGLDNLSPGQMAERAIGMLYRCPDKLHYIRTLDVLGLDESGAIPCEVLAAMCHVLRYVRDKNVPFGGLLLWATMDYLQLDPVSGSHPLMSPTFAACFYFRELVHSVRAALDANFKRLQQITRMASSELVRDATKIEFVDLFVSTFSFVRSATEAGVPHNVLFVFGKNAPIRIQERQLLDRVMRRDDVRYRISVANDEERTIDGQDFCRASSITSDELDRKVKEPRQLMLYEGGRYQITSNKPRKYSNSQLAILFELPSQEHIDNKRPIALVLAPPGSRFIPDINATKQELLDLGWVERKVGITLRRYVINTAGSTRSRRQQYALRPHVGATIHAVMGQTLGSLLTRVERGGKSNHYSLWLAAQVIVLLSRTRLGANTYFWLGNGMTAEDTAETVYDLLCRTSPFRDYLSHLLRQLCAKDVTEHRNYTIDQSKSIYRPCDVALPSHDLGYAYLLVSTRDLNHIYLGSTHNLAKRLQQHNAGYGSRQTQSVHLRPWALLAYIVGFDGDKAAYEFIENNWIAQKQDLLGNPHVQASVQAIHNIGKDIVATYNILHRDNGKLLRFVSCGTIERVVTATEDM